MQYKKSEFTPEAGVSVEKLRGERLELLPDRIELKRRHGRRNRHHNHGGFNNPSDVDVSFS
jgi:hypothetical protein